MSPILQRQKLLERIRLGLENHFLHNWKQQNTIFSTDIFSKKQKIEEKRFDEGPW